MTPHPFSDTLDAVQSRLKKENTLSLTGLPGGSRALFVLGLAVDAKAPLLVITQEDIDAEGWVADLEAWSALLPATQRPPLLVYPEQDPAVRIASLGQWRQQPRSILVASQGALSHPTPVSRGIVRFGVRTAPGSVVS